MKAVKNQRTQVRSSSFFRQYAWLVALLIALGGQVVPKIGLLVLPIMGTLAGMAFFKGRYWCGNYCPHGSFFDRVHSFSNRQRTIPRFFMSKALPIAFLILFFYVWLGRLLHVFSLWGETAFWDRLGHVFAMTYLVVVVVGGSLAFFFASRTWCKVCPMGTVEGGCYRVGKLLGATLNWDQMVTMKDRDRCRLCGKCSKVCPLELSPHLEFSKEDRFENELCIRCGACVTACPLKILSLEKVSDRPMD